MLYRAETHQIKTGGIAELENWRPGTADWIWLELSSVPAETERELLKSRFNIDDLEITDAQRDRHPPKFEAFEDHVFLLFKELSTDSIDINYTTLQLACFLGNNFIITRRDLPSNAIEKIWSQAEVAKFDLTGGPTYLTYLISRSIVDCYTPIILALEERLEIMEDEMFSHSNDTLLAELMNYNSQLKKLRRNLSYQKNLFANLKHHSADYINKHNRHEFNDIYEQFERLSSLTDLHQELTIDLINGYISLSSHRLNHIIKILTIVTVLFLPLSLLAGIYGMNFEHMPELHFKYGYFGILGIMMILVIGIIFLLRKLKWV